MIRPVLRGVERKMAVRQFDAPVGLPRDVRIVRDHQNGVAGLVQLTEQIDHDLFVGFVQIAGRLVGQNQFRLIDQRARDSHTLLFASGKLRWQMRQAFAEADTLQRFRGLASSVAE